MKPESEPQLLDTHETVDVSKLSKEDRAKIDEYLQAVDEIDAAYKEYRRSGAEVTRAKKSGDQEQLSAAMQAGNTAEELWRAQKEKTKHLETALPPSVKNFAFGDKRERQALQEKISGTPEPVPETAPEIPSETELQEQRLAEETAELGAFNESLQHSFLQLNTFLGDNEELQRLQSQEYMIREQLESMRDSTAQQALEHAEEVQVHFRAARSSMESLLHERIFPFLVQQEELGNDPEERMIAAQNIEEELEQIQRQLAQASEEAEEFSLRATRWYLNVIDNRGHDDDFIFTLRAYQASTSELAAQAWQMVDAWKPVSEQARALSAA